MPRDYRNEREMTVRRWYGQKPTDRNPRPQRSWSKDPIRPEDGFGIQNPVNHPFTLFGHCIAWRYTLDSDGYGTQKIDNRTEKVHRAVYRLSRAERSWATGVSKLSDSVRLSVKGKCHPGRLPS